MSTPLKAFAVTEKDEGTGGIYFARHDIAAKRLGATEHGDDISAVSCRRAPWADQFAEKGTVPAWVMIAHGWHFECNGCDERIDGDWLDDRRLPVEGVIGTQWGVVYCCDRCRRKAISLRRRRKDHERAAIAELKEFVQLRLPDADFCDEEGAGLRHHAYVVPGERGGWHRQEIVVAFRFPGMTLAPATCEVRPAYRGYTTPFIGPSEPKFYCCGADREAFEAWAATSKARAA